MNCRLPQLHCYPLWDPFEGIIYRCQDHSSKRVQVLTKKDYLSLEEKGEAKSVSKYTEKSLDRNRG